MEKEPILFPFDKKPIQIAQQFREFQTSFLHVADSFPNYKFSIRNHFFSTKVT